MIGRSGELISRISEFRAQERPMVSATLAAGSCLNASTILLSGRFLFKNTLFPTLILSLLFFPDIYFIKFICSNCSLIGGTGYLGVLPDRKSSIPSAQASDEREEASFVAAPMCGAVSTLSISSSGFSLEKGSSRVTSRAAPAICFSSRAFISASSSMMLPRAVSVSYTHLDVYKRQQ